MTENFINPEVLAALKAASQTEGPSNDRPVLAARQIATLTDAGSLDSEKYPHFAEGFGGFVPQAASEAAIREYLAGLSHSSAGNDEPHQGDTDEAVASPETIEEEPEA